MPAPHLVIQILLLHPALTTLVVSKKLPNCDCLPQFTGDSCYVVVNECAPNPCQNNGTCSNTFPGFECMCVVGYTGTTCEVCVTGYVMESGQCGKRVCMLLDYTVLHHYIYYSSRL